jgi:hypothetical protein
MIYKFESSPKSHYANILKEKMQIVVVGTLSTSFQATPPKLEGNFNHSVSKTATPPKLDGNFNHPVSKATPPPHWSGINVNASFYDIREYFQGRDDKGRMNCSSDDERYNDLILKLRIELKELAKQIEPKIYKYVFLIE